MVSPSPCRLRASFVRCLRVGLPVAVAAVLVCLAIINMALVKTWRGEPEDGVLWGQERGANVVAREVASERRGCDGRRAAGRRPAADRRQRESAASSDVIAALHAADDGQVLTYDVQRAGGGRARSRSSCSRCRSSARGCTTRSRSSAFSSIVVGASVRLRRPNDPATLHFFWLTVAFFGVLAFTPSGRYDRLDYFFDWADVVARLALPPLFLHFAFVFPERPNPWVRSDAGRAVLPAFYLPALLLGVGRIAVVAGALRGPAAVARARADRTARASVSGARVCSAVSR